MHDQLNSLFDAIDRSSVIELLAELVRYPSHYGIQRQEEAVALALARYLETRGLGVELREVSPGRPNVICRCETRRPGRHLVLCGHTDTVPLNRDDPGVGYSAEIRNGVMYGRGTVDMKGGVAAMAAAVVALAQTNALPAGAVTLAAVVDEERESIGAEDLVRRGFAAEGAIIGEPTRNELCLGHKGLEWIEMEFVGKAAHGSTPAAGINAITAAARFIGLVESELHPRLMHRAHPLLGPPTINFGTIQGGDQPSTVAARAVLTADRRSVPGETADTMFAELRELLGATERQMPGLKTELRRVPGGMATLEHTACVTEPQHPLSCSVQQACESVKSRAERGGAFPAWTDGALLASFAGIPSVVLGPGDLTLAHSPRECVEIREVIEAAKIYAAAAVAFCRG